MKANKRTAVIRCCGAAGCAFGCLGCRSCAAVCPRQAISFRENGSARADREKCIGCGKCVKACPQQLIELVPAENTIQPFCAGQAAASSACAQDGDSAPKEKKAACAAGCIGCGICEKVCPAGAIRLLPVSAPGGAPLRHAVIDQDRCIACGMCAVRCPRGVIHDANGLLSVR